MLKMKKKLVEKDGRDSRRHFAIFGFQPLSTNSPLHQSVPSSQNNVKHRLRLALVSIHYLSSKGNEENTDQAMPINGARAPLNSTKVTLDTTIPI